MPTFPQKSVMAGKIHGDTNPFDDFSTHLSTRQNIRIVKLRVIHDYKLVFGIESFYEADGFQITAGSHVGRELPYGATAQEISFQWGEVITSISGRHGDVIDFMQIQTSSGQTYQFGGSGGSHQFNIAIPYGKTVMAFYGGLGGHLHNIGCYYK
jgi:hypothetical protein